MMNRTSAAILAVVFALIILISLLLISDSVLRTARLDLTESQKYTLSQGTKRTLATLREPITLKLFFSDRLSVEYPSLRVYGRRVKDLLREYEAQSKGMVRVEFLDTEPFSEAEDEALALGLSGAPTESSEQFYFALVGSNAVDGQEVIPFLLNEREAFLEYDLTSIIYKLSRIEQHKVGLLSSIPLELGAGGAMAAMQGQVSQPFYLFEQLRDNFDLVPLTDNISIIDPSIKVLVIVHPDQMSDQTLYAIDQYVLNGGRVVVFVDPLSELSQMLSAPEMGGAPSGPPLSSSMEKLFDAWGVAYDTEDVVSDMTYALQVQTGIPQQPVIDYPVWLAASGDSLNARDIVTGEIELLQMASAGVLQQASDARTAFSPLVVTSDRAMLSDVEEVRESFDPIQFLIDFRPTGETYTIAARISGDVSTAFPNGRPAAPENQSSDDGEEPDVLAEDDIDQDVPHVAVSQSPANIVVVADTDLWDDKFWVQRQNFLGESINIPIADNGPFVINIVENLLGSNELINLRSRGRDSRPLIAVENLRKAAEARYLTKQKSLEEELQRTEQRLSALQSRMQESGAGAGDGQDAVLLTAKENEEMERFTQEYVRLRRELRMVERDLRTDIEGLQSVVVAANLLVVPLFVGGAAIFLAIRRTRRRRQIQQGN